MIEMTLELAERAMKAAQAKARALGTPMTVTIVDEQGRLVLSSRGDGAGFLTPTTSLGKAVAAAAFRRSTKDIADKRAASANFWDALPSLAPGVLPTIGGVPVTAKGRVIGAIGCGGGTGEQDHECAMEGARTVNS